MKVQNPLIGRSRGSAGGMTFAKVYDKNVVRAKAFEVNNPKTAAQTTQRNYFKKLSGLASQFTEDQLRTLFPNKPKAMSRRNALAKQLAEYNATVGDVKSVDYESIDTLGNASTMNMGTTTCQFNQGNIEVGLDNIVKANASVSDLNFIAAIVNDTKGEIYLTTDHETVEVGTLTIAQPTQWENTDSVHAIPLITNIKGRDPFKGFGSFIIKTRAEKK